MDEKSQVFGGCDAYEKPLFYGNACVTICRNAEQVDWTPEYPDGIVPVIDSTLLYASCAECGNEMVTRTVPKTEIARECPARHHQELQSIDRGENMGNDSGDAGLAFREATESDPVLTAAMLQQAGECHELDLPALAERVGEDQVRNVIDKTILSAMEQRAVADREASIRRCYSVWLGQKSGKNAANQSVPLAFVYVVQHSEDGGPDPDDATEADAAQMNAFDEAFGPWPEYVRMEYANPLWDGARPWYVVDGNVVTLVHEAGPAYSVVADEVLAGYWQGQYMLKETAGDAVHTGDDDAQMGRGALAYLRNFVRDRRCIGRFDLPDHVEDLEGIPEWVERYFDAGGVLFHTQDCWRDQETVLLALTDCPELPMEAQVGWALELDDTGVVLSHLLAFKDPENDDVCMEFLYVLADRGHLEELASLASQDEIWLYVFTADDEGSFAWIGKRAIRPGKNMQMALARKVAPIVLACAPNANVTEFGAGMPDGTDAGGVNQ